MRCVGYGTLGNLSEMPITHPSISLTSLVNPVVKGSANVRKFEGRRAEPCRAGCVCVGCS